MDLESFIASTSLRSPPTELPPLLRALWHEARGHWAEAHAVAQDEAGADAAWVHAYLHRKEGDVSNADYWYRNARRDRSALELEQEWREIATALLAAAELNSRSPKPPDDARS